MLTMEIEDILEKLMGRIDFESDVWDGEKNINRIDDYAKVLKFAITKLEGCAEMKADPCIPVRNCGNKAQEELVDAIFRCISIDTYKQLAERIEKYADDHSDIKEALKK
jgi:hypothetical protein